MAKRLPNVSVVVPAYRAASTIAAAIESVQAQTFSRHELIVVDDGSDDDTAAVAASYGSDVHVIRQQNSGVSRARNAGLARARGQYVAFLDADDAWHPAKLERQVECLTVLPHVGLCFTGLTRIDGNGRVVGNTPAIRRTDYVADSLLYSVVVNSPSSSVLSRTALVRSVGGFDPRFSQCADWDFSIRLGLRAAIEPIDEPLVSYRVAAGSMSSDIALLEFDTFRVLDTFYGMRESSKYSSLRRRAYANQWRIISGSYLQAGRLRDAVRCIAHAVRWHPSALAYAAGLPARARRRHASGKPDQSRYGQ